jgi:ribosome-binding protein aMBF1 (putative translation factor)
MIQNALFHQCLAAVPKEHKAEFELSFSIAERISDILKDKGLTQKEFASLLGKRESEVSKWLTGRHNFTIQTIARIEYVLGSKVIVAANDDVSC